MHFVEMHEIIARQHWSLGDFSILVIALSSLALFVFKSFCAFDEVPLKQQVILTSDIGANTDTDSTESCTNRCKA